MDTGRTAGPTRGAAAGVVLARRAGEHLCESSSSSHALSSSRLPVERRIGPRHSCSWRESVIHNPRPMKILSICQPWAYLITQRSKDIENRSWRTRYRGPFLVHASRTVDREGCLDHGLDPSKLQTGGVVGIAEIVDCVQEHRSRWFVGPYGFVLKKRRPLPFVNWTGALGLRDAPTQLLHRIKDDRGKMQCIYVDPPYGIKFNSNWGRRQVNNPADAELALGGVPRS